MVSISEYLKNCPIQQYYDSNCARRKYVYRKGDILQIFIICLIIMLFY